MMISISKQGVSVKFLDKLKAFDLILRHFGGPNNLGQSSESALDRISRIIDERAQKEREDKEQP